MSKISIPEFLSLTRISKSEMFDLLSRGDLPISVENGNTLLIDTENLTPELLAKRLLWWDQLEPPAAELLEERIANEVLEFIDSCMLEAEELVARWRKTG